MKASILCSPLLMGCLLLSLAGQGVCEERRVMILPEIHIPPYHIIEEGNYGGIAVDIYRLLARNLNWNIDFLPCPSMKRCFFLAAEGKLDIGSELILDNQGYRDYLYYLQPPIETSPSTLAFYLQNSAANIGDYDDLSGLTVGILYGFYYFEPFGSDSSIHKVVVINRTQLFNMLAARRIDTIVGIEVFIDRLLNKSRFINLFKKSDYRVERKSALHIVVPSKSPFSKERLKIEEAWRQLVESGKVRKIYKKNGVELPPPTQRAPK